MQGTNALRCRCSKSLGGAEHAGLGGIPIIQFDTFWIHKNPGEALGWRGWFEGRVKILVPQLHYFFLQCQDKSLARCVTENKGFMVRWWSGVGRRLWSLILLWKPHLVPATLDQPKPAFPLTTKGYVPTGRT